ncbi:MAG: betaine--homocysteine S-methyltransferase [Anaerolineae bacterium]|nr:betaine--homocysteine S-methyltransferase [Anaerolineae bacterium]MCB9126238.1 betaine--homocysteine S-methyltransferase [Caldilineaceae bacterium]
MTDRLLELLQERPLVMGDGAMGTMLQRAGLIDGGAPELWNVERPDVVRAIYQGYRDAGSDYITTNSFGGTRYRLKLHKLQDRVFELNQAAAALAREVAGDDRLVAGSVGPTGELMVPLGPLTMDEARAAFAEQVEGLAAGGADFILIETMSSLDEVQAAVEGAREASDLPVVVTMTFDTNFRTMMGVTPAQAVQTLSSWGVTVIGANCGNGPAEIERIMWEMAQVRPEGVVLMAQSNAGLPRWQGGEISYDGTPEVMADYAQRMRSLGVQVIGACCGSTPDHLQAMRVALDGPPLTDYEPQFEQKEPVASSNRRSARRAQRARA